MHVGEAELAAQRAGLVGDEAEDHHLRRVAGEGFAGEGGAAAGVGHAVDGLVERELAAVGRGLPRPAEVEQQIAEGLVGTHLDLIAGPQRLFVELDVFLGDTAVDHRAEGTVADRQGFVPIGGGLVVPERLGRSAEAQGGGEGQEELHGGDQGLRVAWRPR